MSKRMALFALWAGIGFVLSLEWLYLFTPFGIGGLLVILPLIWVLEGRGLNKQPDIWGLLAGPGLFCLLIAASADEPSVWVAVGSSAVVTAVVGFALSGRAQCARGA